MNLFNRLILLIIALLMIAVPVFLLLVNFGVIPADQVNSYTGYRNVIGALDSTSGAAAQGGGGAQGGGLTAVLEGQELDVGFRSVVFAISLVVALVSLFLILREIPLGRRVARRAFVDETPGRETAVTARAVRNLAEGAAREAGAVSPTCYLASKKRRYDVSCNILVPKARDFTELAASVQQNIRKILGEQQVPVRDVEVTIQGTEPQGQGR